MPIRVTPRRYRKAAGFVFSENEIAKLAEEIMGEAYDPAVITTTVVRMEVEKNHIGLFFYHVFQPKGKYESAPKDDIPRWIITLVIEEIGQNETLDNFSDIPLSKDLEDEEVQKAIRWLEKRGFTRTEVEEHWATFTEDCFRYYKYPESGDERPNPLYRF